MMRYRRLMGVATLTGGLALLGTGLIWGLSPTGDALTFIGIVRMCFLLGLLAVTFGWQSQTALPRWGAIGAVLATVGAPLTLLAAIAHGLIDGWDFDPFENADGAPPWYSMLVALGAIAFAAGSVLVGAASLRTSTPRAQAIALIGGGVLYLPAIPLGGPGHALWAVPWVALGAMLVSTRSESHGEAPEPVGESGLRAGTSSLP